MKNKAIPIYQPFLGKKEKKYAIDCLDENWISSKGKYVNLFESSFCNYTNIKFASTCSNGTVALHLALEALGIGPNDEVIVPALTYIASVNAIKYTGASPVFIDSKKDTWNIDENKIDNLISNKTKAILVVHLYGNPCNMDKIIQIARSNNLYVIEDCAESFGTEYKKIHTGNFGDVSTFSFFGNKTITTGEGGMVASNNKDLIEKINKLKNQGLSGDKEYFYDIIGYNYRMTNICAAIGLAQLSKSNKILELKRLIFDHYKRKLSNCEIVFQKDEENSKNSYWMVSILFKDLSTRERVRRELLKNKVETRPLFPLINTMPMYKTKENFDIANGISKRGINLPSFPSLKNSEIKFICDNIISALH